MNPLHMFLVPEVKTVDLKIKDLEGNILMM